MKNLILLLLSSLLMFNSCDIIEGPFDEQVVLDTTAGPKRKILLEDFTGHQCGNCPCAADEADYLSKDIFKNRVIVVASHIGFFARTSASGKFSYDFRTATGNAVDAFFGIGDQGLPKGMVNRDSVSTSTSWASEISSKLAIPPDIDIKMSKTYDPVSRTVNASIDVEYLTPGNSNHKLVVYVVEDSIINWQAFYASCGGVAYDKPDYVHRHVLRGSINTTWGDNLSADAVIPKGTVINKTYSTVLNSNWKEKHISLVAFVHDNTTKKVIQAEEIHLY